MNTETNALPASQTQESVAAFAKGIAGVGLAALINVPFTSMIPCHGFLFELTLPELAVLAGVPFTAYRWTGANVPHRWWSYYGIASFVIMWPSLSGFFFTIYEEFRMNKSAGYPLIVCLP